jgi:hypothetical protein
LRRDQWAKGYWQVGRDKAVAKEYYAAEATSHKEILNPDVALVPNEQLLAQNGIKMLEHQRGTTAERPTRAPPKRVGRAFAQP